MKRVHVTLRPQFLSQSSVYSFPNTTDVPTVTSDILIVLLALWLPEYSCPVLHCSLAQQPHVQLLEAISDIREVR
jgi:hypothetical protein